MELQAFYCYFSAWSKRTDLITYDEFLYAESDSAARADFESKIAKKFGANWREELSKNDVTVRNLTRIVHSMVQAEKANATTSTDELGTSS